MQIAASWTITQTATDLVGVSKGILEAATSDNVQPIALLAAEKFGATLAMSLETCRKVEMLCSQSHQSTVINTLKAYVGYKKGDSGWQLAQSDSGVRFLGLVACLLTMDHWIAAGALSELITETATDRTILPTVHQLKQLMHALDYRLARSGFADTVLGYGIWLDHHVQKVTISTPSPSKKVVVELVKAMSSLGRLGENRRMRVRVPEKQAPWIIAFVKYSFGLPPSVFLGDEHLLVQADSPISINVVAEAKNNDIEIVFLDELGDISELLADLPDGMKEMKGMISVRTYAQKILQYVGVESSIQYRACLEIFPYGCYIVLRDPQIKSDNIFKVMAPQPSFKIRIFEVDAVLGSIFPAADEVSQTLAEFLGSERPVPLKPLPEGSKIESLPTVVAARRLICSTCPCEKCLPTSNNQYNKCKFDEFLLYVSYCIVRILTISLLVPGDPEGVLVRWRYSSHPDINDPSTVGVLRCLMEKQAPNFSIYKFIGLTKDLLDHKFSLDVADTWIMSSYHGQTIFPQLLESRVPRKTGILRMVCASGSLYYKGEPHKLVVGAGDDINMSKEDSMNSHEEEIQQSSSEAPWLPLIPTDAYQGCKLIWQIHIMKNRLHLSVSATSWQHSLSRNPIRALSAASQSIFVDCNHDRMAEASINGTSPKLYRTSPRRPTPKVIAKWGIGLVQSNENELMRFFSLTYGTPGVIRGDACLDCCYQVCRILDRRFIIC